ncbi:MAG: SDR family NAD(P)-dependent oxidoreductase [Calditrichia bacterium]
MKSLAGKIAVVTGGGRDIGRHICLKLAEEGASVVVNYNSSAAGAEETVSQIVAMDGKAVAVQADVTKWTEAQKLPAAAKEHFGGNVDVLVNNAGGLMARKRMHEMDEAFWDLVMDVNMKSMFLVTKACLENMNDGGAIVNLASLAGRDGGGGGAIAYSTSKGAALTFTRGLAKELKPRKIRVNAVSPGLIATTFHDTFTPDDVRKMVASKTLAEREGQPEDVANAVLFLATDKSSYINGESIEINSGLYFI